MPDLPVFHAVCYLPCLPFLFHKDSDEALVIAIHHRRLSMDHRKTIHTNHQEQLQLPFQASTIIDDEPSGEGNGDTGSCAPVSGSGQRDHGGDL